ncbi:lisH domain-containing protein C1711.05-like [Durio zibethinus]|uniref:LisH domain-containing protein C1711.05-like n=1 Tax=Durio zibethinus TaxID=66656 RepID=A0A6P5ZKN1_DURZI|nr:lisH domain-containing protein C1711.05-like [Durio zibethinus]
MLAAKLSSSLLALKPRQVLLSFNLTMKSKASAQSLNPHQKSLLLLSIAHFLERNFFSKTLKKFLLEAQIQKNDLIGSSLDLEEMCCKYLAMSDLSSSSLNRDQVQDMQVDGNPNSDEQAGIASAVETASKKKKKRGNKSRTATIAGQSEVDKSANSKNSEEQVFPESSKAPAGDMGGLQLDEYAKKEKEKKKKKSKLDSESHVDKVECYPSESLGGESEKRSKDAVSTESNRVYDAGIKNETKDKKKKKNKLTSDSLGDSINQHGSENRPHAATTFNASDISLEDKTSKSRKKKKKDDTEDIEKGKSSNTESKHSKNSISKEDSTITESKGSKKRKRLDPEVHDSQPVEENAIEDSKRRKTESSEEKYTKLNSLAGADKPVSNENNGESGEVGVNDFQKKPAKQLHEQENENIDKNGKNSEQKGLKKHQNGSVEPKKPFQRVNIDDVVFVDSRLEDNSYWAKDGAENGYGAKAQGILGQVRGRDFRHEKTKKKRGSYRGGQIDLQSHSVKFNYSDDE